MLHIDRRNIITSLTALVLLLGISTQRASAFPTDTYVSSSRLSSGRWVKVSVERSGMHFISHATLRSWGFSDPSKVRIYGYGGNRLSNTLSLSEYTDDLPMQQTLPTSSGIWFYAVGPEKWTVTYGTEIFTHSLNPFSERGYYFVSDTGEEARTIPTEGLATEADGAATTFTERLFHEQDLTSPGETGHMLVGEDFRYTSKRTINFELPGKVEGTNVWMQSSFVTRTKNSGRSTVEYTANGNKVEGVTSIGDTNNDNYGIRGTSRHNMAVDGEKLALGLSYKASGVVYMANLDAIDINYTRALKVGTGPLHFSLTQTGATLAGGSDWTVVWDVTSPLDIVAMNTVTGDGKLSWVNSYTGRRYYAAWHPETDASSAPTPRLVSMINNQDLHGITDIPQMVIITVGDFASQAERIAAMHRANDGMNVLVVDQQLIFNEFGSGSADVNAIRRFLKMLYDRGQESDSPLKFALLFGRATYDHRVITQAMKSLNQPHVPTWQSDESLSDLSSYSTDDIFAFLEDNSGTRMGSDNYCIAVGRMPVRSLQQASEAVDKLINYVNTTKRADWKNRVAVLADNGNEGTHMFQAESMINYMMGTDGGTQLNYNKIYIDAFNLIGGTAEGARNRLTRLLDEGLMWWTYIGHGDKLTLASENVFTYTDINDLYQRYLPVLYASTCSYSRWDGSSPCAAEHLFFNTKGGVIASFSSTRKAIIQENGKLTDAVGKEAFLRDAEGQLPRLGEIFRRGKNRLSRAAGSSNDNKLFYVLMGDPAMPLTMPSNRIVVETIGGKSLQDETMPEIKARENVTITGSIYDPTGTTKLTDFNGTVASRLYDAEYSTTSLGLPADGTEGREVTFEEQGEQLYAGRDSVKNGEFSLRIPMPSEISENYRPAALNLYAYDNARNTEAVGMERGFVVYGYDDSGAPDTTPPTIDYAFLNHDSFATGSYVNETPMFIASVTDDVGINMSSAGIGHQMTLRLDDRTSYSDVSQYFTPASDGSPSGTIAYQLPTITDGPHRLTLRVWDTSGNSSERSVEFNVRTGLAPKLFDVYTDANPASTHVNFYLRHDRPDATVTATIAIYNLQGHMVWTSTVTDRSDMFMSAPITWNLQDMGGSRVSPGIYIYRAAIMVDGREEQSMARRIAVTRR